MRMQRNWTIRLVTCLLWLLATGSVVYWALKFVSTASAPAYASVVGAAPGAQAGAVDSSAVARALGGGFAPNLVAGGATSTLASGITASRFVLTGVVDGTALGKSIALIAIDAKPARPYRVGGVLEAGVVLRSVEERKAVIGPQDKEAGGSVTLELPARAVFAGAGPAGLGGVGGAQLFAPIAPIPTPAPAAPVTPPPAPPPAQPLLAPPVVIAPSANPAANSVSSAMPQISVAAAADAAAAAAARAAAANGQMPGRFGASRPRPGAPEGAVPAPASP